MKMGVIRRLTTMESTQKISVIVKIKTLYDPRKVKMSRREISSCFSSIEGLVDELEAELEGELDKIMLCLKIVG